MGELSPELESKMPFSSLQEAFDQVLEMAQDGEAFCQYTVANTYFWWDFVRIQGRDKNSFSDQTEYMVYLRENISKCEDWFWKAFRGGMYFGANNLYRYSRLWHNPERHLFPENTLSPANRRP